MTNELEQIQEGLLILMESIDKTNDTIIVLLNEQKTFLKKFIKKAIYLVNTKLEQKSNE